jgi:DNA polymerase I-like protein with 3'-5' exonuclease and polymerase domains
MLDVFAELKIPTKDKDGKDSIKENILIKTKHEFVDMWLNFQEANHRVTTFGDKIYQQIENNRIYTHFNPMVDTARLSVRKGNINFLNFPRDKETRNCFKANIGNKMVVCDLDGQENVLSADFTRDTAMLSAVNEGRDLHCMLTRVLHPELKALSDEEIMTKHKQERQDSKPIRFAFAYGGNAYTIHQNGNISYEEALEIEKKYKKLHAGIYAWGNQELNQSLRTGYIESVAGWKLKLPEFKEFKEREKIIKSFDKHSWDLYKEGKMEYKKIQEAKDKGNKYFPLNKMPLDFYKKNKSIMSKYYKQKSEYSRLCLNSPIQTAGAHQIKMAGCLLFDWILENNLVWKVKICNSIYDELVIECIEKLAEVTRINLQRCMIEGANHYLSILKSSATASIGVSWGEAK